MNKVFGVVVILISLGLVGCTVDVASRRIYNPQAEAQATRMAKLSEDEVAKRAIERQVLQAGADKARVEADAAEAARPALVARNVLIALGLGVAVVVILVGSAFVLVAWLGKRATSVYPDEKGQYPVMIRRGFGWLVMHDPNRGLGPSAVYRTPTTLHVVADVVHYLRTGKAESAQLDAAFPQPGSEATMAQIAGQAQAVGLMAAATRPAGILGQPGIDRKEARQLAGEAMRKTSVLPETMPVVRVIDDPQRIQEFAQLLEGGDV